LSSNRDKELPFLLILFLCRFGEILFPENILAELRWKVNNQTNIFFPMYQKRIVFRYGHPLWHLGLRVPHAF
jgi:hypothetical protein